MEKKKLIKFVKEMQAGDEHAYNEIYAEFYEPMLHIAIELTHNEADAKDIVQNTFIQIHQSVKKLQEPTVFVLWMKRILTNKCQNFYRARKNMIYNDEVVEARLASESKEDSTKKLHQEEEGKRELYQLVAQLDYIHREVIVLYYFDQLKIKEIANILGISEGTVKSRMNAAKVSLRRLCEQYERIHHERISLHIGGIGFSLCAMYAMKANLTGLHKIKFKAHAIQAIVGTPTLVLTGIACSMAILTLPPILQNQQKLQENLRNDIIYSSEITDQSAYFKLRSWAHCKDEMEIRDKASYEHIRPYFVQLQEHNGVYWEALQADGWAEDFIKISSSK